MAKKKLVKKSPPKKRAPKSASAVADSFLKVGAKAPAFSLLNEQGETVSLKALKGQKVILYFYPKDHTPGCTQESCDFRDQYSVLKKAGVQVFGISRDSVESHSKFKTKLELPFSLLADVEGKMCEAYGVWKEKSLYGRKYMGIERTTIVIDEKGKITQIYPKVSVKGHVQQMIKELF